MPSIFEFIDYRKFLEAYYREQKEKSSYFSFRYFARRTGINSPSFLRHVIDGKRNLTRPAIEKFSAALKLTTKEATYFRNLVLFNQAKTSAEKQEHYAVLRSMAGGVKESVLNADQYDYFAYWYVPVIRELVALRNFGDDYRKLAAMVRPAILPSEAKAAVKLLLRLKLIRKQENGTFCQANSAITADGAVTSLAVRSFTRNMIERSNHALDTVDRSERHISGLTMGISHATFEVIAAEIDAFKDRLKIMVNQDQDGDRVYQMNISLFPVSEDLKGDDPTKGTAV
ncbi:MAG: TIGR02147 family protein [Chitinispirillaceae bacterium]|nr:TIGR02147 family protein [Chitinispirillaceae bacterium]